MLLGLLQLYIILQKVSLFCAIFGIYSFIDYEFNKKGTVFGIEKLKKGGKNMRCPFCNQDNTRVVDSRPVEETNSIRRRRMCDECGKRFTTYERVETIPLVVIKKDQTR